MNRFTDVGGKLRRALTVADVCGGGKSVKARVRYPRSPALLPACRFVGNSPTVDPAILSRDYHHQKDSNPIIHIGEL